jgi:hypothetical protein
MHIVKERSDTMMLLMMLIRLMILLLRMIETYAIARAGGEGAQ